jgi:hypothetical protein
MSTPRWLAPILVIALAVAGPFAPLAALAQTPAPPPPPPLPPPPPMHSMQPEGTVVIVPPPGPGARVGASVLNVAYVPGKGILCGIGTVAAGALMLLTFGSAYRESTSLFKEGCTGPWVITPEMISDVPPASPFGY